MAKYKQERRQRHMKEQRRNTMILVLVAVALLVGVIALPSLIKSAKPVGDFTMITPEARSQAEGRGIGNPDAPVKIEVFEDFQCPACADFTHTTEKQIVADLIPTGQVYYFFRQYPFLDRGSSHESAQAANASMCALEQGRFWDYHDMLYGNQNGENLGGFADKRLVAFANSLGLDMKAFDSCFTENRYKAEIDKDLKDGGTLGVTGTPSLFVNGKIVNPGYIPSFDDVKKAVDTALGK